MRVLFVTPTLTTGGAEMMLAKLLKALPRERFAATVACLGAMGRPADLLRASGIDVVPLSVSGLSSLASVPFAIRRVLRDAQPDLVQGWMYHGNLAAWTIAAASGFRVRLAWSVRQTLYDIGREKRLTQAVIRMNARASRRPERIIYVSELSRAQHAALGFSDERACVIANGFDVEQLRRREEQRARLRAQWGVAAGETVIGHLARFHPAKDQATLLRAAQLLVQQRPHVRFAIAGPGLDANNEALTGIVAARDLGSRVLLLGETTDPAAFLSACDLFCLSSLSEGFPNALGEAMACELPAVATSVGECSGIVGDCGVVVPPGNADELARGLLQLVDMSLFARSELGARARRRIADNYSLPAVAARYLAVYETPADARDRGLG